MYTLLITYYVMYSGFSVSTLKYPDKETCVKALARIASNQHEIPYNFKLLSGQCIKGEK